MKSRRSNFHLYLVLLQWMLETAEGLTSVVVTSKKEITHRIDEGTTNRSIASTNMNETSSRAHTIVVISLTQRTRDPVTGVESSKTSSINLVDLAGR